MASAYATETELIRYPQPAAFTQVQPPAYEETTHELDGAFSLPPTDGGKHAWLLLFSCFMLEGMIWGALRCSCQSKSLPLTKSRLWLFVWRLSRILQHP
jgi:hypothetical protein